MNNEDIILEFIKGNSYNNKYKNISCDKNILWSYSSKLAEFDRVNNVVLIDEGIASYSVTSKIHCTYLKRYLSYHNIAYYEVVLASLNDKSINYLYEQTKLAITLAIRARTKQHIKKEQAVEAYKTLERYLKYRQIPDDSEFHKLRIELFTELFKHKLL